MARATTLAFLAAAACLALLVTVANGETRAARRELAGARTPGGWWHSLRVKGGQWCGLRDFPPKPDGYGTSRLYCIFGSYDHYWMWRVSKVPGSASLSLNSGDSVYLSVYQPMLTYCKYASGAVICGVGQSSATKFTIEGESGSGAISLLTDTVYLKVGSSYCRLSGKKHAQKLACDAAAKRLATPFQLPASSFASVQLLSAQTNKTCGGDFYNQNPGLPYVGCGAYFPGEATNFTVALQTPGSAVIAAGSNVTFKAYDDLYTYQVSTWKVNAKKETFLDENNTSGSSQWFTILPINAAAAASAASAAASAASAAAAAPLANGTLVALRSAASGAFCGVTAADASKVMCDNAGPAAALPRGYTFTYVISSAA